jgi:hypothetical protein
MSARFLKIFSGVLLSQLVIISLIWVGFSVPLPRSPATFTWGGTVSADDNGIGVPEAVWQKGQTPDVFGVDHQKASGFDRWIRLREPLKPNQI